MHSQQRKVLRTICPDQKGLIARITNMLQARAEYRAEQ
jgi:formyltetrahydrofolate deformylase